MKNKLREIRKEAGLTQHELSKVSGICRTTLSFIENGKEMNLSLKTLIAISKAVGKPIDEIFLLN